MASTTKKILITCLLFSVAFADGFFIPELITDENTAISSSEQHDLSVIEDIQNVASVCAQAILGEIPSTFCWKTPANWGKIPEGCAPGTFRSAALCYEDCDSGYGFWGGVCWETCPAGYHNDGAICGKDFFHWFFKKSYVPTSYTNFSDKSLCPKGMYKQGALCYNDCANIGLDNCGIGACAASSYGCAKGILSIAIEAAEAVEKLVNTVVSIVDGSSPLTLAENGLKAMAGAIAKGAEKDLTTGLNDVKELMSNPDFQTSVVSRATEKAASWIGSSLETKVVTDICTNVGDYFLSHAKAGATASNTFHWPTNSAPSIFQTVKECQGLATEDAKLLCAKEVLNFVNEYDPTGITGLVAAFIKPVCVVEPQTMFIL